MFMTLPDEGRKHTGEPNRKNKKLWGSKIGDMPQRPRPHVLEEESRKKFREAIPSQWVVRRLDPDYGIDEHIELFDETGDATGLSFLAQVKGTDSVDIKRALGVPTEIETLRYYRSLDTPVMVVSYHSPTGSLFWRWAYEFDPYYARKGSKQVTFTIPKDNRWGDGTPSRVRRDLETFRRLRSPNIGWPIEFELVLEGDEFFEVPAVLIESAIREAFQPLSSIIKLRMTFRQAYTLH